MDDFFGGMFDFNGDGVTDWAEQALGFAVMEEQKIGTRMYYPRTDAAKLA